MLAAATRPPWSAELHLIPPIHHQPQPRVQDKTFVEDANSRLATWSAWKHPSSSVSFVISVLSSSKLASMLVSSLLVTASARVRTTAAFKELSTLHVLQATAFFVPLPKSSLSTIYLLPMPYLVQLRLCRIDHPLAPRTFMIAQVPSHPLDDEQAPSHGLPPRHHPAPHLVSAFVHLP